MYLKWILLITALVFFEIEGFAQTPLTNQRVFDTIPFLPDLYAQKIAQFEMEPVNKGNIIFLGNSITQGGNWKKLLNDDTIINRGIGGDITYGVLKRLGDIIERKPSKLFIMIGINDIGKDIPVAVITDNYRKIVQQVQQKSPETQIYIQSVLPLNPEYPGFPQHYDKHDKVLQLNPLIKELASRTNCHYVDLFAVFQDSRSYLKEDLTGDGLHVNEKGYELWAKHLKASGYL